MDDCAAFLRTIFASPDDMMPRLVWADWLSEHGDDREEWVRGRRRREPDEMDIRACKELERLNVPGNFAKDVIRPIAKYEPGVLVGHGMVLAVALRELTFRQWLFIWIIAAGYRDRIRDSQVLAQLQEWFPYEQTQRPNSRSGTPDQPAFEGL